VARPQLHATDTMLDAARELVLERGARAATVAEIARVSGAPSGSIYNRFTSLDDLLAQMWIRAVRRSQADFVLAAAASDAREAAVAAALSVYDFCVEHPADARLLLAFRRSDLLAGPLTEQAREELERLNEPVQKAITELARRLYGRAGSSRVDLLLLALFDLPHGAVRRPLLAGQRLSPGRRTALAAAVRAALG
jgi:AcrR family transcriptional regulator